MFGRKPNEMKDYSGTKMEYIDLNNWKTYQEKVLSVIYPSISDSILDKKNTMVNRLNSHRKQLLPDSFPNGSIVMLVDELRKNKFEPKYVGPYTIVRRSHNGQYVLRYPGANGDILDRHVPSDKLKFISNKARPSDLKNNIYYVHKIIDHRGSGDSIEYLTQWKDYLNDPPTWTPSDHFIDTACITKYWKTIKSNNIQSSPITPTTSTTIINNIIPSTSNTNTNTNTNTIGSSSPSTPLLSSTMRPKRVIKPINWD
jgi:hypothetical protein